MKLITDNIWARVEGTTSEIMWLDEYTSCEDKRFRPGRGYSDGLVRLYDAANKVVPAGLAYVIEKGGNSVGIDVEIEHTQAPPCTPDWTANISWLRDYQLDTVKQEITRGGRGLVKIPTGGGKTESFIASTRVLPVEWLFVVHRSDIVEQTRKRYQLRTRETAGTFEKGEWRPGTCNVTVSTFQALYAGLRKRDKRTMDFLNNAVQALNVDESHAQPADSFYIVSMSMPRAFYRIGQSGTPFHRGNFEKLRTMGALGPIIYKIKTRELIDKGYLSEPQIRMVVCKQHGDVESTWREVYDALIVHSKGRNQVITDIAKIARKPSMLFVDEVAQGNELRDLIEDAGVRVGFTQGRDWKEKRLDKVAELVGGDLDVLITTPMFQEGIDIPKLKSVINGAGKQSAVAAIQRMGRGMRTCADGDDRFEMWDVLDHGHRWLQDHANERRAAYESEGFNVEVL